MIVFADTGYWIALLNPKDRLHARATALSTTLKSARLVTSDFVLSEVLSYFCGGGPRVRDAARQIVRAILENPNVEVVPATHAGFLDGLELYEERLDKGYSHVDCVSIDVMKKRSITDVLADDQHFVQEGFRTLLREDAGSTG